ncbi:small acid-soluble spore protein Tlp [Ectobacillus sp. sgz5001026]|uniref:small acid-soluble spore protein Tlp n=1 Tax=Ectobacillus sp. sgz5001026 TaxID=3242473 RepID=UPI0036D2AD5E
MRVNKDDRSDNVEKLQSMVHNTLENIHEAEETARVANEHDKASIDAKNAKRMASIAQMRNEIRQENRHMSSHDIEN